MYKFSSKSQKILDQICIPLADALQEIIKISRVDFGLTDGLRTTEQQQAMFAKGASQCDGVKKKSKHQEGLAVDIVCYSPKTRKVTYDKQYYYYIAGLMQQYDYITWGGWWSFEDCCHFELDINKFRQEYLIG